MYTSPELVQVELRATSEFSATTVPSLSTATTWIAEAEDYVNSIANKKYGENTYTEYLNYSGEEVLYVKNSPLLSVTSVSYDDSDLGEDPSFVEQTDNTQFKVDYNQGAIILYPSKFSTAPKNGVRRFKVVYTAGHSTIPGNIQMLTTKLVANRVLSSLINDNVNSRNAGGSISVGDIRIVEPADYGVGSFKQLKSDIVQLQADLIGGFRVYRYG